jgi:hypothetical protein
MVGIQPEHPVVTVQFSFPLELCERLSLEVRKFGRRALCQFERLRDLRYAEPRRCEQELGPAIAQKPLLFDIRKVGPDCAGFVSVTVDQVATVIAKEIGLPDSMRHAVICLLGADDASSSGSFCDRKFSGSSALTSIGCTS